MTKHNTGDNKTTSLQNQGAGNAHARSLEALARRNRLRQLNPRTGIDFASNDYLGLAQSPELKSAAEAALARGVPAGSGGSRLLRGNTPEHEALEAEAAAYFGSEAALFFGGGFIANSALFATLPQRGDLIIYDALIHASAHDGIAKSRAQAIEVPHNAPQEISDAIKNWRGSGGTGQVWIAVETIYSMDGDKAPLDDLVSIADQTDAILLLDEAHATGIFGPQGRGLGAHLEGRENVVSLHTCGKALGVMGALVTGPKTLMDFMVNRSRAFIYATAPSPLIAAMVRAALVISKTDTGRREKLHALIAHASEKLSAVDGVLVTGTPIQPVIVGTDTRALQLAEAMQAKGFDVRAVRPPTVPEGTARLRIALTLNVTMGDVDQMVATLKTSLADLAA